MARSRFLTLTLSVCLLFGSATSFARSKSGNDRRLRKDADRSDVMKQPPQKALPVHSLLEGDCGFGSNQCDDDGGTGGGGMWCPNGQVCQEVTYSYPCPGGYCVTVEWHCWCV